MEVVIGLGILVLLFLRLFKKSQDVQARSAATRALSEVHQARGEIAALRDRVMDLERRLAETGAGNPVRVPEGTPEVIEPPQSVRPQSGMPQSVTPAEVTAAAFETPPADVKPAKPQSASIPSAAAALMAAETAVRAHPQPSEPEGAEGHADARAVAAEHKLTDQWLVWLGGIILALGGVFLVKYSIDQGLLLPWVRVTGGILLGGLLSYAAGWLDKRAPAFRSPPPAAVAPALAGAGTAMIFASLYAAYALYGLIPEGLAFAGLAATSGLALLLALRHGPYVAALGLAGAYAVPLLINTDTPNVVGLFAYLLLITATITAVMRVKAWWWLAWATFAACFGWFALWVYSGFGQAGAALAFLLGLQGLAILLRLGVPGTSGIRWLSGLAGVNPTRQVRAIAEVATVACAVAALFGLSTTTNGGVPAGLYLIAFTALTLWFARRDALLDRLLWVPFLFGCLAVMQMGSVALYGPARLADADVSTYLDAFRLPFRIAVLVAGLNGVGGFLGLWGARKPAQWAALSVAAPLALLLSLPVLERFTATRLGIDSLALSAILASGGFAVFRHRRRPGMEGALAAYAVGVVAGITLAAFHFLAHVSLTMALSVIAAGVAAVYSRLRVQGLAQTAIVLAVAVLVRLVLDPSLLDYTGFWWIVYGYGVPALALGYAAGRFRSTAALTADVLESAAICCTTLLVNLELRTLIEGSIAAPADHPLIEATAHAVAWLGLAMGLFWLHSRTGRRVPFWAGRVLWMLSNGSILCGGLLYANPWVRPIDLGPLPILDLVLFAYGLPAAFYTAIHRVLPPSLFRRINGWIGAGLALCWLITEVHRLFVGPVLTPDIGGTELVMQALLWLGLALAVEAWQRLDPSADRDRAAVGLWGAGTVGLLTAGLLLNNPWVMPLDAGPWPLFDRVLWDYGVPALAFVACARWGSGWREVRIASTALAAGFGFVWISLETHRLFVGRLMPVDIFGQSEVYTYSVLWLAVGIVLLARGVRRQSVVLRRLGLGLVLVVVGKAFFIDLGNLTGLWRAASFLGLGLVLVGLGWLYRRLERPRPDEHA